MAQQDIYNRRSYPMPYHTISSRRRTTFAVAVIARPFFVLNVLDLLPTDGLELAIAIESSATTNTCTTTKSLSLFIYLYNLHADILEYRSRHRRPSTCRGPKTQTRLTERPISTRPKRPGWN